jgi:nicotinic acid phosphoribosyltransferase
MDQELESYKRMRKNLQELINQQFAEILDQISTDPNFSVIQYKAIDEVLRHLENGLLKYSEGVQFADNEMLEFLEKVKHQVKTSIFDHGSQQVANSQSNKN